MILEKLQKELDNLPSQDPQFIIGWLMAQVIYLKEKENEKAERSELEMASSFEMQSNQYQERQRKL